MSKRKFFLIGLVALMALTTGILTAAAPVPNTTFTLVQGLPETMNLGETATVIVQVDSDQTFLYAQALPSMYYPGRGVVAAIGDRTGKGTSATLEVTFTAKNPTNDFANAPGYAPVSVTVGVRYPNGYVESKRYDFVVTVP